MSEFTRRTLVQLTALPLLADQAAHHDHSAGAAPASAKPARVPFFSDGEFATLRTLCDLILPADEHSPAASTAGAPEFIELLSGNNARLAKIFRGGLAWLNGQSGGAFVRLPEERQTQLLDRIADRRRAAPADAPGAEFFDWSRRLTVDAFYTSPAGYKDVDYRGGKGMTTYAVPPEVIAQALKQAGLE